MNYLTLEHITKSFGEKVLFRDLDLLINQGDKMALVAQNGTGKTTLLEVIAGEESPEGENHNLLVAKGIRIGYLRQEPDFDPTATVIETVFDSDNPMIRAIKDYERAMIYPDRQAEVQAALTKMDELQAWDFEATIKEILFKLAITDLEKEVGMLSGGQRKRLSLAQLLIDDPDFLILDEPTNHLDLDMIEWLEGYLSRPSITLFMVTHDRYFLERVCNQIVELDRGNLYKYSGSYSDFLYKKTTRHQNELIDKEKNKKLLKQELAWMGRQPRARTTKAKSRINAVDAIAEAANMDVDRKEIQIDLKGERLGSKILNVNYISKAYGDKVLVKNFYYKFKKNERVGIVGRNGAGKSTLVKMLTGQVRPDSGNVVVGGTVKFGFYTQEGIQLETDKRVIDVITDIAEYIPLNKGLKLTATGLAERFLFDKKQQQVYVSKLSGGERRRLYLLTVIMQNPNFLILDEPTNDLDILTLNVLENFLLDFPGCVIIITHDRFFMDKIVDHLFVFQGEGRIKDFNGKYSDYREWEKAQEIEERRLKAEAEKNKPKPVVVEKRPSNLTQEQRKQLKKLERQVAKLEEKKKTLQAKFNDATLTPERIQALSIELGQVENDLEEREMAWLELAELE